MKKKTKKSKVTKRKYTRKKKVIEISGMNPRLAKGLYEALAYAVYGGKKQ